MAGERSVRLTCGIAVIAVAITVLVLSARRDQFVGDAHPDPRIPQVGTCTGMIDYPDDSTSSDSPTGWRLLLPTAPVLECRGSVHGMVLSATVTTGSSLDGDALTDLSTSCAEQVSAIIGAPMRVDLSAGIELWPAVRAWPVIVGPSRQAGDAEIPWVACVLTVDEPFSPPTASTPLPWEMCVGSDDLLASCTEPHPKQLLGIIRPTWEASRSPFDPAAGCRAAWLWFAGRATVDDPRLRVITTQAGSWWPPDAPGDAWSPDLEVPIFECAVSVIDPARLTAGLFRIGDQPLPIGG